MSVVEQGASFSISSDYVETSQAFTLVEEIIVYVEGFEDKSFWKDIFKNKKVKVTVESYCQKGCANGKGTLLADIRRNTIKLGSHLLVALDSDYDYLLNKNSDVLNEDTVFQTYSYSIENIIWNPEIVDSVCQKSSCCGEHFPDDELKNNILEWSKTVYPLFLNYLKGGASDDGLFTSIISSFQLDNDKIVYKGADVTEFLDTAFIKKMETKGLRPDNVYLFIRGHDLEDVLNRHCKTLNNLAFTKVANELKSKHGQNAGQHIRELSNKRCEPFILVRGAAVSCDFCIPKIESDIDKFMTKYH